MGTIYRESTSNIGALCKVAPHRSPRGPDTAAATIQIPHKECLTRLSRTHLVTEGIQKISKALPLRQLNFHDVDPEFVRRWAYEVTPTGPCHCHHSAVVGDVVSYRGFDAFSRLPSHGTTIPSQQATYARTSLLILAMYGLPD